MPSGSKSVPLRDGQAAGHRGCLGADGRTTRKGMPKLLDLPLLTAELDKQDLRRRWWRFAIQQIALAPPAWSQRKRGLGGRCAPPPALV